MRLRAALADARGVSLRTDWECQVVRFMRNVWFGRLQSQKVTTFLIPRLRSAATRDSVTIWLRCAKWTGLLLMEDCETRLVRTSPTW